MGDGCSIKRAGLCAAWLGALAVPACGGTSSSASCGSQAPCGGNVVGTWKVESACEKVTQGASSVCPSATIVVTSLTVSGELTFGADSSYSSMLTESGSLRYTVPSSCLTTNGQTLSCSQLGSTGNVSNSAFSCQTSGSDCICNVTPAPQTVTDSGTYQVIGTSLSLMPTGRAATSNGFCATSSELRLSLLGANMGVGMMSPTNIDAEIIATKQ